MDIYINEKEKLELFEELLMKEEGLQSTANHLIHIGKPVFLIAFSVSLPIEPGVILGIMAVGTLVLAVRMVLVAGRRYDRPHCGIGSKTIQGEPPL